MKKLENKTAVITGGNSGIGLATAVEFKQQGAQIAILGRDAKTLQKAAEVIGDGVLTVQGDVTKVADLERLYQKTAERFGKVDVLVVSAGVGESLPFEQVSEAFFDRMFAINVKGAFFTVQKALPHLNDGASVVLLGSSAAGGGFPGTSVYAASKAAVRQLARTLSAELKGRKIRVNAISPGLTDSPGTSAERLGMSEEAAQGFKQFISGLVGRLGKPEEIAKLILYLASDDSAFVLGGEFVIDGGLTEL